MTAYFLSTVNPEDVTYATSLQTIDGTKLLKDAYYMVWLNGRYRRCSVEMRRDEDDEEPAADTLRMRYALHVYGNLISSAQAVKLNNIDNIPTVIVWRK